MTATTFAVVALASDDRVVEALERLSAVGESFSRIVVAGAGADADAVLRRLADERLDEPWILVGGAADHDGVGEVVARVLDGEIGVFGLAGVVITGAEAPPPSVRDLRVPAAAVPSSDGDALVAAIESLRTEVVTRAPRVPAAWARVIASSRTDAAVRGVLARRALADDPGYRPEALTAEQLDLLREVARRIVPQGEGAAIDLAARVDRLLAEGGGDGWRPSGMASDVEAYRAGLGALGAIWMRGAARQDEVIRAVIDEDAPSGPDLSAMQLRQWFEDARNDLARIWLAHPASLARVGYSGFATGGTGPEPVGYRVLAAGEREDWEPEELGRLNAGDEGGSR